MKELMGVLLVICLIIFVCLLPFFMGKWCSYNTELLVNHYMKTNIDLPNWPFVLGAYLTQCALPYGIVSEVWCHCVGVK